MKDRVQLTARKGNHTMKTWVMPERASEVGRAYVALGYAVTITFQPGEAQVSLDAE